MTLAHWLHHLFNPHCNLCALSRQKELDFLREQDEVNRHCDSCEILKLELARIHSLNEKLIDSALEKPVIEERSVTIPDEIRPKAVPWNVKRQLLEETDREAARIQKEHNKNLAKVVPLTEDDLDKEIAQVKEQSNG
jgi:hypothetical protein